MDAMRISSEIGVARFEIVEELDEVLLNQKKGSDVVSRIVGEERVQQVLPVPAVGVAAINELAAGAAEWFSGWQRCLTPTLTRAVKRAGLNRVRVEPVG